MKARRLWQTGPSVGEVGLGCMGMSFGYSTDPDGDDPVSLVARALDIGVNFFDTADIYGPYTNEEVVGRAVAGRRDEVVLATKGGNVQVEPNSLKIRRNGTPEHLRRAIDASLKRLDVDHVDLYYLHQVDADVPIEDSVGALGEMVAAGKTRAIGLSKVDVPTLERAQAVHPIKAVQSELSLWSRDNLAEVVPWCEKNDAAFVPFAPLGRGFLAGRYRTAQFRSDDVRSRMPRFQPGALEANLKIVAAIERVAGRHEATAAQVAIAWVLAQSKKIVPIPGTRRVRALTENAGASRLTLTDTDLAELNELPPPVEARQ